MDNYKVEKSNLQIFYLGSVEIFTVCVSDPCDDGGSSFVDTSKENTSAPDPIVGTDDLFFPFFLFFY